MIKKTLCMRGIPRAEMLEYLIGIGGFLVNEYEVEGNEWRAHLEKEDYCSLGSLKIVEVAISFEGEEKICEELVADFRMQFLRAGG